MGAIVGARLVRGDGSVVEVEPETRAGPGSGQVEYRFQASPELLPADALKQFDMWRYSALLPLEPGPVRYPLPVGGTPLLAAPALREAAGMPRLWLKDETRGPSGSNKDRATALVLEHALRSGAGTVSCASMGNVATSLAVGTAACGLQAVVFVPAEVSPAKLVLMRLLGAVVVLVRDGYERAFQLSEEAAGRLGWTDRNTGVNPATLDAKKTVGLEVWEQLGRTVPDAVVVPVGDGPTLCGIGKAFEEIRACGGADRLPRLIAVQAEGCQPLKRAWEGAEPPADLAAKTIAEGIAVTAPTSPGAVLRYVRESGGGFVAVSDEEMLEVMGVLAARAGVVAEPAGAAAFAGLRAALRQQLVDPSETVVVLVTGSGLKTPQFLRPAAAPIEIDGGLDELTEALESRRVS